MMPGHPVSGDEGPSPGSQEERGPIAVRPNNAGLSRGGDVRE